MPINDPQHWQKRLDELEEACDKIGRKASDLKVVAVTKGFEADLVRDAWDFGFRHFGENRVAEALEKKHSLRNSHLSGSNWHMIGHLQSKKVRKIVDEFVLIHSVDRSSLVQEISKRTRMLSCKQPILMQVNVSGEKSKYGVEPEAAPALVEEILNCSPLQLRGLMTMAPWTDDKKVLHETFANCRKLRDKIEDTFEIELPELSMGMTNDYYQAIEEGATMLRLGRFFFGDRP